MDIHIEHLEPMRVAYLSVRSENAEAEALGKLVAWAKDKGVTGDYRLFGFDNCQPHPNHIYTAWITVGAGVQPDNEAKIRQFPGGRFAVCPVKGVENISYTWTRLYAWQEIHGHLLGNHPGLEAMLSPLDTAPEAVELKLYLSLAEGA